MLLLDDNNQDIVRKYEITFEGENVKCVVDKLKSLLVNPIIVSTEVKKGILTDLYEPLAQIERVSNDPYDIKIVETQIQNIRKISDYVKIADAIATVKKYNFTFSINFILSHLPNIEEFISTLDHGTAECIKLVLSSCPFNSFLKLSLLLHSNSFSFEDVSKIFDNDPNQISTIAEIDLFKQVFSYSTLTEVSSWTAPFSIAEKVRNFWRYEESDRYVIENSINIAKSNEIIVKKLSLKPYKKIINF